MKISLVNLFIHVILWATRHDDMTDMTEMSSQYHH